MSQRTGHEVGGVATARRRAADRAFESASTILVNSVVAAVLAAMIMVLLHELVHLVAGLALGHPSTLYPFGVAHEGQLGSGDTVITSFSAVLFSLVTGFLCALWLPLRRTGGFLHLLWLWFAFTSIMEGAGYLMITALGAGDTAVTAEALGAPVWAMALTTLVGVGLMFVAARLFAPHVRRHAGTMTRSQWAFAFWPWIIATVASMALAGLWVLLADGGFSTGEKIAVVAAGMGLFVFAPMSFIFARAASGEPDEPLGLRPVPVAGLVGIALMTAINIGLLRGLHLG